METTLRCSIRQATGSASTCTIVAGQCETGAMNEDGTPFTETFVTFNGFPAADGLPADDGRKAALGHVRGRSRTAIRLLRRRSSTWRFVAHHRRCRLPEEPTSPRWSASSIRTGDPRRDPGYTLYYLRDQPRLVLGKRILCGLVERQTVGWWAGFGLAGVLAWRLAGWSSSRQRLMFWTPGPKQLAGRMSGNPPEPEKLAAKFKLLGSAFDRAHHLYRRAF